MRRETNADEPRDESFKMVNLTIMSREDIKGFSELRIFGLVLSGLLKPEYERSSFQLLLAAVVGLGLAYEAWRSRSVHLSSFYGGLHRKSCHMR